MLFFCYLEEECGPYGPAGTEVSPRWARQKRAAAGFACTFWRGGIGIWITDFLWDGRGQMFSQRGPPNSSLAASTDFWNWLFGRAAGCADGVADPPVRWYSDRPLIRIFGDIQFIRGVSHVTGCYEHGRGGALTEHCLLQPRFIYSSPHPLPYSSSFPPLLLLLLLQHHHRFPGVPFFFLSLSLSLSLSLPFSMNGKGHICHSPLPFTGRKEKGKRWGEGEGGRRILQGFANLCLVCLSVCGLERIPNCSCVLKNL